MARFVIDAATLLRLVDQTVEADPAHQLVAPNSIRSEALDLLLRDVGEGSREESEALLTHERLTQVKMRLLGDRVSRAVAWRIARSHPGGCIRDAEYVAIAQLQADALVTADPDLAAMAAAFVDVAPFTALLTSR